MYEVQCVYTRRVKFTSDCHTAYIRSVPNISSQAKLMLQLFNYPSKLCLKSRDIHTCLCILSSQ